VTRADRDRPGRPGGRLAESPEQQVRRSVPQRRCPSHRSPARRSTIQAAESARRKSAACGLSGGRWHGGATDGAALPFIVPASVRARASVPPVEHLPARKRRPQCQCVEYLSTIRDASSHRPSTGRPAAFPDGCGLGARTDAPDRLRRPSGPRTSKADRMNTDRVRHVRHHLLVMGTAGVNRCGSVRSLISDHQFLQPK
jgi:hypothetical protein